MNGVLRSPIRVGVIGCGYWGPNLIRNFARHDGARVVAACDAELERRADDGELVQHSVGHEQRDGADPIEDVDLVVVATPSRTHYALAKQAILAGKHVLVMKPMTTQVDHAKSWWTWRAQQGVMLAVDHTFVYSGAVRKMRDLVVSGELGDVFYVDSVRINLGVFQSDVNVIWDLAAHDVSILDYVLGGASPTEVTAVSAAHAGSWAENIAYLTMRYPPDVLAHRACELARAGQDSSHHHRGSRRMAVYDDMHPSEKLLIYDRGISIAPWTDREAVYGALVSYDRATCRRRTWMLGKRLPWRSTTSSNALRPEPRQSRTATPAFERSGLSKRQMSPPAAGSHRGRAGTETQRSPRWYRFRSTPRQADPLHQPVGSTGHPVLPFAKRYDGNVAPRLEPRKFHGTSLADPCPPREMVARCPHVSDDIRLRGRADLQPAKGLSVELDVRGEDHESVGEDVLSALGLLSRQPEIAETYAQAGQSRAIRQAAIAALSLDERQQVDVALESRLIAGSNLLQLSVTATDPDLAQDYNTAVGAALVEYANELYPSFELVPLDSASAPGRPISPNIPLNLAVGLLVAFLLAAGVGYLAAILTPPARPKAQIALLDADSTAYSSAFFMLRLRQEMSRVRRTNSPLSIALVNVNHSGVLDRADARVRREALARLAGLLDAHLRIEDLSARLEGDTFALLLTDTSEAEAMEMVEGLRARLALPSIGADPSGQALRASPAAGVVEYRGAATTVGELVERARRALLDAEAVPAGKTQSFTSRSAGAATKRARGDQPVRDPSAS